MPALLQVSNLEKYYGPQKIFDGLTFSVNTGQKIGIIGRNGAGKSTLFKIILGQETADNGTVMLGPEAHLGYLRQEEDWRADESALDYLLRVSGQEEWTVKKLASAFELKGDVLNRPALNLSGGWRMRLKLSGMLLQRPNLFLLDEPTNYLDLNTLILLENYLKSYKGSFLIISHDREFLKKTCEETLEINAGGCYHYPGPLEEYLAFKELRQLGLIKANEGLQRQQEHLREFAERFRAKASKAKQAQAALRKIEKLEAKRITIEHQAGITRIVIPPVVKRKSMALKVKNLTVGYDKPLVSQIVFEMLFGERLVVLGQNGQGKTTLLKTLADLLPPLAGSFHWFSGGKIAYHAQESMEVLKGDEQVGIYLRRQASPDVKTEAVLKMASDLLFNDRDLKKTIGVLSGGEKSRLLLGGILLSKPDILILDEPTSHLDFETVEALGVALSKFAGAIIFTSHDRTFTNLLSTGMIQIEKGLARRRFQDYEDYIAELELTLGAKPESSEEKTDSNGRQIYLEQKAKQKNLAQLEKELARLNQQHAELMFYFTDHPTNYTVDKVRQLDALNAAIKEAEERWLNQVN
ncbi:MAG: ABC-F family ATP-binding cassette domain-containing protein [Candidatus Falkowbacteria bacterium]